VLDHDRTHHSGGRSPRQHPTASSSRLLTHPAFPTANRTLATACLSTPTHHSQPDRWGLGTAVTGLTALSPRTRHLCASGSHQLRAQILADSVLQSILVQHSANPSLHLDQRRIIQSAR
jgi:hypothetical protein